MKPGDGAEPFEQDHDPQTFARSVAYYELLASRLEKQRRTAPMSRLPHIDEELSIARRRAELLREAGRKVNRSGEAAGG